MPTIRFKAKLFTIRSWTILQLPPSASKELPSRGIVMVTGTINGQPFQTALEPDGNGSHWFQMDKDLRKIAKAEAGDTVTVAIEPTKKWPEPKLPEDIAKALASNQGAHDTWMSTTPLAHWEWIRWIRATNQMETRLRRIEVACSKLKSGERRPCCFNSNMCTEPYVSQYGVLLGQRTSPSKRY